MKMKNQKKISANPANILIVQMRTVLKTKRKMISTDTNGPANAHIVKKTPKMNFGREVSVHRVGIRNGRF